MNPTPRERMLDAQGRPYFLWDCDLALEPFRELLEHSNVQVRAYWIGKLMRHAKPDDVFEFVSRAAIEENWELVQRHLGRSRPFWVWLLEMWRKSRPA